MSNGAKASQIFFWSSFSSSFWSSFLLPSFWSGFSSCGLPILSLFSSPALLYLLRLIYCLTFSFRFFFVCCCCCCCCFLLLLLLLLLLLFLLLLLLLLLLSESSFVRSFVPWGWFKNEGRSGNERERERDFLTGLRSVWFSSSRLSPTRFLWCVRERERFINRFEIGLVWLKPVKPHEVFMMPYFVPLKAYCM